MIEINLLPAELKKKEAVGFKLPDIPTARIFITAVILLFAFQMIVSLFAFYQRVEALSVNVTIASLKKENSEILRQKTQALMAQNRLKEIQVLTRRDYYWSSLLAELTRSMTRGVWLREFSTNEKNMGSDKASARYLSLKGSAIGQGQETAYIGKFVKALKENKLFAELFSQVELTNINQRKIYEYDVYDFEIMCVFKSQRT